MEFLLSRVMSLRFHGGGGGGGLRRKGTRTKMMMMVCRQFHCLWQSNCLLSVGSSSKQRNLLHTVLCSSLLSRDVAVYVLSGAPGGLAVQKQIPFRISFS